MGLPLYEVEISEEHRGRGLGRRAMSLLDRFARDAGAAFVDLAVFGANTRALALYESCGHS